MSFEMSGEVSKDHITQLLGRYAQNILVVIFGLLPIFFVPTAYAPFEFTKIFLVLIGLVSALILVSLSVLRSGSIVAKFPRTLVALWLVAAIVSVSAILSGDVRDALVGDQITTHSAAFVGILALIATLWGVIGVEKAAVMRLYMILATSTIVLVFFHVLRLIFGADAVSFGIFTSLIASPLGSWNDLALFLGLSVLLSLVALEQLPLTKAGKWIFGLVAILALCMLAIINFFTVWLVLGVVSLVVLVYTLGKDRFSDSQMPLISQKSTRFSSLPLALIIFAVSTLFIVGGATLGGMIAKYTGVSHIEVRPSLEATADIARQVYDSDALLGIGPNRFVDAWRLFKDQAINPTIFWNTEFNAGNGYITTFFVTAGVLGGLAWALFLIVFLISGILFLLTASDSDKMWYFIGVSSFVSAAYIWSMSVVYVPGAVVLMLGALCTGIMVAAQYRLDPRGSVTFSVIQNRRAGFIVTLVVIAIIIGSVSLLYGVGRYYASAYMFNRATAALNSGASLESVSADLEQAYALTQNDTYARRVAEYQLARMNQLLNISEPTDLNRKEFESLLVNAVNAANQATQGDSTEPANWSVLGSLYNLLVDTHRESVYDRGLEALTKAKDLDPKNPAPYLALAVFEERAGNKDEALARINEAIALKPNFVDAFFYLSQIQIKYGDLDAALQSSASMISLEPQNPARYYQLGVLEAAKNQHESAVVAFERAVELDPNFANALYLLAISYDAVNRPQDALEKFNKVLELNPGNANVEFLIDTLKKTGSLRSISVPAEESPIVNEQSPVTEENGTVTTNEAPNSSLVTPVNTVPTETTPSTPEESLDSSTAQ